MALEFSEFEDKLMRNIRYLDKLIDELAKGKSMDKILRKSQMGCWNGNYKF